MSHIYKSAEQAIFVMILLAIQLNHTPVKSSTLSGLLMVSDSYLKKIIRKLAERHLVIATTGPGGGVCIARPANAVTMSETCRAVGENPWKMTVDDIEGRALLACNGASQSLFSVARLINEAGSAFDSVLHSSTIADHLPQGSWETGLVDWNTWWDQNKDGVQGIDLNLRLGSRYR